MIDNFWNFCELYIADALGTLPDNFPFDKTGMNSRKEIFRHIELELKLPDDIRDLIKLSGDTDENIAKIWREKGTRGWITHFRGIRAVADPAERDIP